MNDCEEDDNLPDGRRPKAYVRFDRTHEKQTGPMLGPFDGLKLVDDVLTGLRNSSEPKKIAERSPDGRWLVLDFQKEPPYLGFDVVFS